MEDDQGYVIAMQRTDTFHPGERKSIGGIDSGMPLYLLISSGSEEKKRQSKLYVSKDLPLKVWFKLTFIPWRYRAEFIVSVLPEGRAGLSWILKDNTNNRRKLACGGWLVDRYRMDVVEEFKNFRFDEDHPREHVLCNPLAYTESERLRIESELSKK
ncbi:hypothetical protein ACTL6P_20885 [Endozoicomonas acroporae]|uniref:hypothetical protein n=1 Tax=Endozoicomonas acroporae TaxID=1701104 RepID=UPI0011AFCF5B|nr:hypothetical protein [Endozoicomonas acroporae]